MLRNLFLFAPLLLLVHVTSAVALPSCPGSDVTRWHNCEGTRAYPDGTKYVGEWADDNEDGSGVYFWSDGRVWDGLWRNAKWVKGKQYGAGEVPPEFLAMRYEIPPIPPDSQYVGEYKDGVEHGQGTYPAVSEDKAKLQCKELGYEPKTKKFDECVWMFMNMY